MSMIQFALSCMSVFSIGCVLMGQESPYATSKRNEPPPRALKRSEVQGRSSRVSASDINKLTTYATILGRAIGCGINVDLEMKRVGKWMDKKFPPGTERQRIYLPIFTDGVKYHAMQQRNGKSPDSCETIRSEVRTFPWP